MLNKFMRSFKFLLSYISVVTMVLLPVAQGAQAESVPKETLEKMLSGIGLNRQITVGEFFKKNKHLFTDGIRKQVEPMMEKFKDQMMPTFEITMLQNPNGDKTPVMRVTDQGQLYSIQMFQDENKTVKFDNTELDAQEVINFNLMIEKLYYHEPRLRKIVGGSDKVSAMGVKRNDKDVSSIPSLSSEVWNKLSIQDKAKYIYNLRRLWVDSKMVLESNKVQSNKNKKTSEFNFFKHLFLSDVEARSKGVKIGDYAKGSSVSSANSNACIVAGNISEYDSNGSCSVAKVKTSYESNKDENVIAESVFKSCSAGTIACNPYIYGVKSDGSGLCIKVDKSENFQKATWSGFGCDSLSPLGKPIEILNDSGPNKKTDRYESENYKVKPDDIENEYKKILAEEGSDGPYRKNIEKFLTNMVKTTDGKAVDFSKELDESVYKQIFSIKSVFDKEIKKAREICIKAAEYKKNEKNFYGACDQLQRRYLLIGEFLKKTPGCKKGSTFDEQTLKCNCESGEAVNPGAECKKTEGPTPVTTDPAQAASETQTADQGQCNPACKEKEICKNLNTANYAGRDKWACIPDTVGGGSSGSSNSALVDGLLKVGKWLLIGAGVYVGVKYVLPLLFPKKPKLNAAADPCANGSIPACGRVCPTGQALLSSGICGCQGCPPGTSITSSVNCTCSTASVTTTLITCSDGVTQVENISSCPATANIKCPDGTYVTNINLCPNSTSSKATSSSTGQ